MNSFTVRQRTRLIVSQVIRTFVTICFILMQTLHANLIETFRNAKFLLIRRNKVSNQDLMNETCRNLGFERWVSSEKLVEYRSDAPGIQLLGYSGGVTPDISRVTDDSMRQSLAQQIAARRHLTSKLTNWAIPQLPGQFANDGGCDFPKTSGMHIELCIPLEVVFEN